MSTDAPSFDHRREVSARLVAELTTPGAIAFAVAAASCHPIADEHLRVTLDGRPLDGEELAIDHHGRLHLVEAATPGELVVEYAAVIAGAAPELPADRLDVYRYVRPSRYCESDRLGPLARAEFAGLAGDELLAAVSSWVGTQLSYVPGSSRAIDGAVATLLAREGVCRDFAHLTAALLRANGVAARVVSVYAPGLDPMDFHAVAEACLDGQWYVVDPTCLAPRQSFVRIATGADASDTAFMTTLRGQVDLVEVEVTATTTGRLPIDDVSALVHLN